MTPMQASTTTIDATNGARCSDRIQTLPRKVRPPTGGRSTAESSGLDRSGPNPQANFGHKWPEWTRRAGHPGRAVVNRLCGLLLLGLGLARHQRGRDIVGD